MNKKRYPQHYETKSRQTHRNGSSPPDLLLYTQKLTSNQRKRNSLDSAIALGHVAPLGLTGERYLFHQVANFGGDSNLGHLHQDDQP